MSRLPISRRTLAIVAVLVGLAALLGYVALRSGPLAPVAVTVVKVETRALRPALFGVGNVEARQLYRIGPTAPGRLLRLGVEVGDTVKAGQVLGEMDPVDSDDRLRSQESVVKRTAATLADATARHAYAETQARRYEQLFAEKATSEELLAARRQDLQLAFAALTAVREDQSRAQSDLQALRAQRLQVGLGPGLILTHGGQRGEGELQILAARGEQFLARSLLGEQLFIAARLCLGVGMARRRIGQGGSGALDDGFLRAQAVVAVNRVHLSEHLAGLDGVAHLHAQAQQPPWGRRADAVELSCLDVADAEQRRAQCARLNLDHSDGHGSEWPGAQGDVAEQCGQPDENGHNGQRTAADG